MLWRHGRTAWNAERRFQGHSDIPLDDSGRAQANAAASELALLNPSKIISSDLTRARDTAGTLADRVGLSVVVDPDLRETNGGAWEGLSRPELAAQFGPQLAAWAAGSDLRPGGGERRSEVAARMTTAIARALTDVPAEGVLVVATHGGAARAAIGEMLGLPAPHWGILGVLSNCAWCVLTETGGPAMSLMDVSAEASEQYPDIPPRPLWRLVEYNARTLPEDAAADDR